MRPVVDDTGETDVGVDAPWPDDIYLPPRRRRLGVWILSLCILPSVALLGWVGEQRYHWVAMATHRVAEAPAVDPRVETFLAEGERAFVAADLETAQGDFDKASVLTEHDPRVLLDEARVAAAKADVPWLKLHLLAPGATEEQRVTKAQLDERVAASTRAADEALAVAPQDAGALSAKLDALRLAGDSQGARGYVVAVFAQATQAETAYALAALDLSEPTSPWATVVDRLRLVSAAEGSSGRAEAALVYALAKSGDVAGAKTELAKLDAQPRPYPLSPELHAWLAVAPTGASAAAPAESAAPAVASASAASSAEAPVPAPAAALAANPLATAAAGEPAHAGGPTTLQAAGQAINHGDFERAERIYQGMIATNPNDSQAQTGLGDVMRLRGDPFGAMDAYRDAIKSNPSYLPAHMGLADTQWARGDKDGATQTYKHIVDEFPDGMYPAYVKQRAAP